MMTSKRDHGDGGIDQRGPDRWRLRWRVGGKRFTKTFRGTKRAAQTEVRRLLKSADDGAHVAPDKISMAAWIEQWIALLDPRRHGDLVGRDVCAVIGAFQQPAYLGLGSALGATKSLGEPLTADPPA